VLEHAWSLRVHSGRELAFSLGHDAIGRRLPECPRGEDLVSLDVPRRTLHCGIFTGRRTTLSHRINREYGLPPERRPYGALQVPFKEVHADFVAATVSRPPWLVK
jgi:hypothetical protein